MSRPTIRDVAAEAGVSVATVSRALSGARGVKASHKILVEQTAQALGYRPHSIARALRESRTMAIGMVVPSINNPFFPQLVETAEEQLRERGLALLLCSSNDDPALEAEQLSMLVDRQVDGLVVSACSSRRSGEAITRIAQRIPTVQFDRFAADAPTAFVGIDDASGIKQILDLAASQGRKRLAYVGAGDENWSGMRRRSAFQQYAVAIDSTALDRVFLGSFTRAFGRAAMEQILSEAPDVDAVICGNDLIAIGVTDVTRERGLSVPQDVAISGFDDISVATVASPSLTTIRQPTSELMAEAIDLLARAIAGENVRDVRIELPVSLVIRESMKNA